ncbi:MAG: hypothetical protein C6H99_02810 [Epsilonproteobacteria bacterium]|nr:hypothetical protein [Campylobacterota bacterium]NPA64738.1 hypothetical protein [Campylobacterota bacterium]
MRVWIAAIGALLILSGCEKKEEPQKSSASSAPAQIKITEGAVKEKKAQTKEVDKGQFYYSYKEANKSETIEDEGRFTTLGAYRHIRSPYERVQISLLVNKLSKDFLVYCSACHDDYANGVIGPSLLGKSGDYIYKQLMEFKTGKRKNVLMKQLVDRLPDSKLKALADEVAAFNEKVQKILEENRIKD